MLILTRCSRKKNVRMETRTLTLECGTGRHVGPCRAKQSRSGCRRRKLPREWSRKCTPTKDDSGVGEECDMCNSTKYDISSGKPR
jgi:hypothetical protein